MQEQERNFFLLSLGLMVSRFGTAIYLVSVVLFIRDSSDNAGAIGIFQMIAHLPILFLAPLAARVTTRYSRKHLMILTDSLRGLFMIAAALAAGAGVLNYIGLLILTVLISVNSAFFLPASHAIFPELIAPAMIRRRNSLKSVLLLLANFGGTALGGAAYARFSVTVIFLFNGLTFLASALQESFIRTAAHSSVSVSLQPRMKNLRQALPRIRGVTPLLLVYAMIHALSPPLILSLPFLLDQRYGGGASAFGLSLSLLLAGGGLGALLYGYSTFSRKKSSSIFLLALFLLPVLIIAAGTGRKLILLYSALAAAGICIGLLFQIITTSLYLYVPEESRGKVFASLEALASLATPISYGVSGFLIQMMRSHLSRFYWIIGAVLFLLSLSLFVRSRMGGLLAGNSKQYQDREHEAE